MHKCHAHTPQTKPKLTHTATHTHSIHITNLLQLQEIKKLINDKRQEKKKTKNKMIV